MMDESLLREFRDKVNHGDRVLHIYRDINGKNKWSVICSAMDWLSIGIAGVDLTKVTYGNDNESSINALTFIMCADIVYEAINQLHRVFVDEKSIPYKADNLVFRNKQCRASSDNEYFKIIRACFSSHAVNIDPLYEDDSSDSKWFASWSGGFGQVFSVILYSNDPSKSSHFFDISFSEIYEFAKKRYEYLNDLMAIIDERITEEDRKWREKPIPKPDDIVDQITVLLGAQKERLDNSFYEYELIEILLAYTVNITVEENLPVIEEYREKRLLEFQELFGYISDMVLAEKVENKPKCNAPDNISGYYFSKISSLVHGSNDCFPLCVEPINKIINEYVVFEDGMPWDEVYITACAGFYKYHLEHDLKDEY